MATISPPRRRSLSATRGALVALAAVAAVLLGWASATLGRSLVAPPSCAFKLRNVTQLAVYHMPKSGGTTLENWLLEAFGGDRVPVMRLPKDNATALVATLRTTRKIILTSKRVAAYDYLYPKMPRLTFIAMRDPIDRIFSHYNYIRGTRYAGACTIGRTATFEEWYESYKNFMPDLNNFEVRLLVSAAEAPDVAARADLDDCDVEPGEPLPEVTKAHVAAATRRLERMSFACDMDRLTLCIRCIAARLSLPLPSNAHECGNVGHKRCGGRRYDGPLRRKMEQDNWGSIDLYRSLRAVAVRDDCRGGCG